MNPLRHLDHSLITFLYFCMREKCIFFFSLTGAFNPISNFFPQLFPISPASSINPVLFPFLQKSTYGHLYLLVCAHVPNPCVPTFPVSHLVNDGAMSSTLHTVCYHPISLVPLGTNILHDPIPTITPLSHRSLMLNFP